MASRRLAKLMPVLVLSLLLAGCRTDDKADEIFFLLTVNTAEGFQEGTAVVEINGLPMEVRRNGSLMTSINEYLLEGANVVRVRGDSPTPLLVSVSQVPRRFFEINGLPGKVLAEAVLIPANEESLPFECELDWEPVLPDTRVEAEAAIEFVESLEQRIQAQEADLGKVFNYGIEHWCVAYRQNRGDWASAHRRVSKVLATAKVEPRTADLQAVVGDQGTIVWCDFEESGKLRTWQLTRGEKSLSTDPILIVRHDGALRVWNRAGMWSNLDD